MPQSDCIFCDVIAGSAPSVQVYEDDVCLAIMDIFPIRQGHVLVLPKQHGALLHELSDQTRSHLFCVANRINLAQRRCGILCDAVNLFINDGKAANQHVPHVHIHLLPRKQGDLLKVVVSFFTRLRSYFAQASHHKRLVTLAETIKQHIPEA